MNSNDAIDQNFIPYPYTFPAIKFTIECPIKGTYLVRDETEPIPLGKTPTDVSVVVHQYRFGWVCSVDGYSGDTTRPACHHIQAAQEAAK